MIIILKIISAMLVFLIVVGVFNVILEIAHWIVECHAHYTNAHYENNYENTFGKPEPFDKFSIVLVSIFIAIYYLIQQFI